jgi:hypothetical protein
VRLERDMREAQEKGEKEREQALRSEFSRLLTEA